MRAAASIAAQKCVRQTHARPIERAGVRHWIILMAHRAHWVRRENALRWRASADWSARNFMGIAMGEYCAALGKSLGRFRRDDG